MNFFWMVVDEGASTYVMSLSVWRALVSPELTPSATYLKYFHGHSFKPHGIFPTLPIELGGKTVLIEMEVVDAPLDYNLLLGRTWIEAMMAVVSSIFRVIKFPHRGKVVTIDQLPFFMPDPNSQSKTNIPMVEGSTTQFESAGIGFFKDSFVMGTFSLPPLLIQILTYL